MIDGTDPCLTCGHDTHPTATLTVALQERTHLGATCYGCAACMGSTETIA